MENRSFRKSLAVAVVVLFLGVSVIPSVIGDNSSFGNTIYVDDDNTEGPWDGTENHPYQFIQDGIDNASDNDTVFVYNGIYYEIINIHKSIILQGQDKYSTIIDGNLTSSSMIVIKKDNTQIQGFTVRNATYHNLANKGVGIYVESSNILISDNVISNVGWGIDLRDPYNCIISQCKIHKTSRGINLYIGGYNNINYNEILDNSIGIYLDGSCFNYINNNMVKNNTFFGLEFNYFYMTGECIFNEIAYNSFIENVCGIGILSLNYGNYINYNNFIDNGKSLKFFYPITFSYNIVNRNYWDRTRLLPKVILGSKIFILPFPAIIIDWFPAREPYDIS